MKKDNNLTQGSQETKTPDQKNREKGKALEGKTRVQFDFTQESLEKLDSIGEKIGAASRAETIRRSLIAFNRLVEAVDKGQRLIIRSPDKPDQEILFWL